MTAAPQAQAAAHGLEIHGKLQPGFEEILSDDALAFVAELVEKFSAEREALLKKRVERQQRISSGELPDFRADTKNIREGEWQVAPVPDDLLDRRVEITGPAEPKMIINALNSGAKVFMADIEDSLSPTWDAVIEAQLALRDAVNGTLQFTSPEGKEYKLGDKPAVLIVRPRGWHLEEKHITMNGKPISGSLFDFGMYFFHNAQTRLNKNTGPYFYIPKLESAEEAALWNAVFNYAEQRLKIPHGSIKATVLIETITAVFEMHEILHAMKDYIVGLNCGRWDYIFSFIKKFHARGDYVLPERAQVTMSTHFLKSYSELLIQTCHKRGAFAMGGMAAQIPVKGDEAANEKAFAAVRADKEREAKFGHDGTWVAHPGLIPVAMEVFDRIMPDKNQRANKREDVQVSAADLLKIPEGTITEGGVRNNINVAIQYTAAWLGGTGCVPINNRMEGAATAEISRSQLWQWAHHDNVKLDDGREVTLEMIRALFPEELASIKEQVGEAVFSAGNFKEAADLLLQQVEDKKFVEFLTLPAYDRIA